MQSLLTGDAKEVRAANLDQPAGQEGAHAALFAGRHDRSAIWLRGQREER